MQIEPAATEEGDDESSSRRLLSERDTCRPCQKNTMSLSRTTDWDVKNEHLEVEAIECH